MRKCVFYRCQSLREAFLVVERSNNCQNEVRTRAPMVFWAIPSKTKAWTDMSWVTFWLLRSISIWISTPRTLSRGAHGTADASVGRSDASAAR